MQYHIQKKHKQKKTRDGLMTGFGTHLLQRTVTKEVVCVISTAREQFLG